MSAITKETLEEALAALPPDADEVAVLFGELGIRGEKRNACGCPMAVFLAGEFPQAERVTFYSTARVVLPSLDDDDDEDDGRAVMVDTPDHLYEFARNFDRGAYPALITVTPADVEQALAALPPEADEVAALFADLGIVGLQRIAGSCPVANYLRGEFPCKDVVFYRLAHVGDPGVFPYAEVPAPGHLVEFADRFDKGEYPELVVA